MALRKGVRVSGTQREKLKVDLAKAYAKGATIRALAAKHNRSYGFIHGLLVEAGADLRIRGGSRPGHRR